MALSPIEKNYNYLTGGSGARGIGRIGYTPAVNPLGTDGGSGNTATVNLENKTGTSNQAATLPGGRETIMARKLDFSC